jgi:toluene monooxygenase system protein D
MNETTSTGAARLVGPIIRGFDRDLVDAVAVAVERDNPGAPVTVDDQGGYVRIHVPTRCVLTRATLEDELGYTFPISQLEQALASFSGRVLTTDNQVEWYLERQD